MGHGFNRQWAAHAEQVFNQHRGGGGPWGGFADAPWGRGRPGPPPWVAGLFGLAQGEQQRGPRVRRGDVRSAILAVLRDEPMNGYQVISTIAERTQGAWKPSPGSVYPTISQLEDEGLVVTDADQGRKVVRLTDEGRTYAEEHADELAAVWQPFAEPERTERPERPDYAQLKPEIGRVMSAVWQIASTGSEQQKRDAIDVLIDTRRRLYGLLADDEGAEGTEGDQAGGRA